jgi:hypothetical protein
MTEAPAEAGQPTPEAAPETTPQASEAQERAFTQKDVNKLAGNARKEARTAFLIELGVEKPDDLKAIVEAHRTMEEEMSTEADKARKTAEKAEAGRQAAEERYTNTLREFALRDALRDSGINPDRLKGAMRLADMSSLEVDKEGNVSGLDEVVEAVKEDSPEWFGSFTERQKVNAPQTVGTGVEKPGDNADADMMHGRFLANLLGNNSP